MQKNEERCGSITPQTVAYTVDAINIMVTTNKR